MNVHTASKSAMADSDQISSKRDLFIFHCCAHNGEDLFNLFVASDATSGHVCLASAGSHNRLQFFDDRIQRTISRHTINDISGNFLCLS